MSGNRGSYGKRMHVPELNQGIKISKKTMYSTIADQVDAFVGILRAAPEFQEYQKQKQRISEQPDLMEAADRIRQENFRLQNVTPDSELTDVMIRFSEEQGDICRQPVIHEYLNAETAFCRLMQDVFDRIMKGLDF